MIENDDYFNSLPNVNDNQAVIGYYYRGSYEEILGLWIKLRKEYLLFRDFMPDTKEPILLVGTNFDLSNYISEIDENSDLMLFYDFQHRVMIEYAKDYSGHKEKPKELPLDEFMKLLRS